MFIHSVGYPGSAEAFADVGLRRPLHATASGKLFLADMPSNVVEEIMSQDIMKYTARTTTSFPRMKRELAQVRMNGYAVNDEELIPGYVVLAAPVLNAGCSTVGAISITLPVKHTSHGKNASNVTLLCDAARKISLQMGYHRHSSNDQSKRLTFQRVRIGLTR